MVIRGYHCKSKKSQYKISIFHYTLGRHRISNNSTGNPVKHQEIRSMIHYTRAATLYCFRSSGSTFLIFFYFFYFIYFIQYFYYGFCMIFHGIHKKCYNTNGLRRGWCIEKCVKKWKCRNDVSESELKVLKVLPDSGGQSTFFYYFHSF